MTTLLVLVESMEVSMERTKKSLAAISSGENVGEAQSTYSFPTVEMVAKTMLAPHRLEIIKAMLGTGPVSVEELSERVERNVEEVSHDVQAMIYSGILDKAEPDLIEFPYDAIHFDFTLEKEA